MICIGLFVAYLTFFWMAMFDRIKNENSTTNSKNGTFNKKAFVGFLFIIGLIAAFVQNWLYIKDPAWDLENSYPATYRISIWILIISYILLLMYFAVQVYAITKCWRDRLARHKTFLVFSLYFIIAICVLSATGYANYNSKKGPGILMGIFLYNFYVWVLQWFYSFSDIGKSQNTQYEKNDNDYVEQNEQFGYMDNLEDKSMNSWRMDQDEDQEEEKGNGAELILNKDDPEKARINMPNFANNQENAKRSETLPSVRIFKL